METTLREGVRALYGENAGTELTGNKPSEKTKSIDLDGLMETTGRIGLTWANGSYLIDAVDDIEETRKLFCQLLLYRFFYEAAGETPQEFRDRSNRIPLQPCSHYLPSRQQQHQRAAFLRKLWILENIIYLGLNRKTEEIITRVEKKKRI